MYIFWFANISVAQKQGYMSEFQSEQQIRNYYASNIALLDPLEGEYDIDGAGEYITPFVHQYYPHNKYKIYIVCNNNEFKVYAKADGDFSDSYFRIEPIGETNAYWMYFHSTATRIYLQDNLHFAANFNLDHASAKKFTGNNRLSPSVNILLTNDCVKVYPTASMYAAAAKMKKEEMQPQEWTGTGFALTNNYIVTNNHVIDGAKSISIQGINGDFSHKYNADVVATDKINDLALLKVSGVNISTSSIPYAVKTNTAEVGEEIFVLGYPLTSTMGEEIKLTTGVISSKTGFQGDVSIYQISAPIQPGNSGGPLFDSKGNVVGIVSAKHTGAENVGYAIKTAYLRNLMESAVSTNILPQTNRIAGQNLSGKLKVAKNYIYYITCSTTGGQNSHNGGTNPISSQYIPRTNFLPNLKYIRPTVGKINEFTTLKAVLLTPTKTILYLNYTNPNEASYVTCNQNVKLLANGKTYNIINVTGLSEEWEPAGKSQDYEVFFPPIPRTTRTIDYKDGGVGFHNIDGILLVDGVEE